MDQVLTGDVWAQFGRIANRSDRKIAAIAYFYRDNGLRFRKGDLLICDASERAIANGSTSAKLLAALHERGVELWNLNGLHAKVAVWGDYAVIGSSNLSQSSTMLTEAALLTNRHSMSHLWYRKGGRTWLPRGWHGVRKRTPSPHARPPQPWGHVICTFPYSGGG